MKLTLHFPIEKVHLMMNWDGICGSRHELGHECQEICPAGHLTLPPLKKYKEQKQFIRLDIQFAYHFRPTEASELNCLFERNFKYGGRKVVMVGVGRKGLFIPSIPHRYEYVVNYFPYVFLSSPVFPVDFRPASSLNPIP